MLNLLALVTIILWPVVPLFWIPVHGATRIFKKLGRLTYMMTLVTWLPLAYLIYKNKTFVLQYTVDLSLILNISGVPLLVLGTLLHIWTGKLLGLRGLVGLPEIYHRASGKLVREGPFSIVRHPTYFAHTLMFSGVFLITEVIATGIITLLDILLIHLLIIPAEEKELSDRFGGEYKRYRERVPKFFPRIHRFKL